MEGVDVFIVSEGNKNKAFSNVSIVEQLESSVRCVTSAGSEVAFKECTIVVLDLIKKEVLLQKY